MNIKQGDKFTKPYPFTHYCVDSIVGGDHQSVEGWLTGCNKHYEDGPAIYQGYCEQNEAHTCDAEGSIEYEVLEVVSLPRKFQDRIIYCISFTDPDGEVRKISNAYMVTASKFQKWIDAPHSSYPREYEVNY